MSFLSVWITVIGQYCCCTAVRVCASGLCACVLNVRSLCLMKFAGDLKISPICCVLWSSFISVSSFSPPFFSLSFRFSLRRSDRWSLWCWWGVSVQVRTTEVLKVLSFRCRRDLTTVILHLVYVQSSSCSVCGGDDDPDSQDPESWWPTVSPARDWYDGYMVRTAYLDHSSTVAECVKGKGWKNHIRL